MESLQRARRPVRREFDTLFNELENLFKDPKTNSEDIEVKFQIFSATCSTLSEHDNKIIDQLTADKVAEEVENKEFDEMRNFKVRAQILRQRKEKMLPEVNLSRTESVDGVSMSGVRKIKLPPVQIKKFSGELEDWLGFWAQFEKIDDDTTMTGSDKFWYLMQSLEPNTDAYEIAAGYPQSNENYPQVVQALKKRFGDEDIQLQVYLRKLLSLVISNVKTEEKVPLKRLFLQLDSHLRALKTLKLEKADPATWLFPFVESSLPEEVLYNWQRSPLSSVDGSKEDPKKTRLDMLMSFIGKEVEINQKIEITRSFHKEEKQQQTRKVMVPNRDRKIRRGPPVPTLSSFHAGEEKKSCAFCDRTNHSSRDCFRARNMDYNQKIKILEKKRLCFLCCGNHIASLCIQRQKLECTICHRNRLTVMCKDIKSRRFPDELNSKKKKTSKDQQTITSVDCSTICSEEVALQIVLLKIVVGDKEEVVRAFLDAGCQRSYILRRLAKKLDLKFVGTVRVVHSLFGDQRTRAINHNKYEVKIRSLEGGFEKIVVLREQEKLCGKLPYFAQSSTQLINELKEKHIDINDWCSGSMEIQLVLGGDLYGSLLTGNVVELKSGTVAIHTKLGWALTGEVPQDLNEQRDNLASLSIDMFFSDASITQLWELEAIGIQDSPQESTVEKMQEVATTRFHENIRRKEDGRYSVSLPWKENVPFLPSNKEVAMKRLQSTSKKLMEKSLFEAYDKIFKDWETHGVIERIPQQDSAVRVHYIPHRPVVKISATTPVRPVFDASCSVGRYPSLNECLLKGDNFILMIPDLLMRFREKSVGFVADIRKAFLMIGVEPEDRNVMRFLWWTNKNMEEIVEYRHARVMFGATCSPFILGAVLHHHLTNLSMAEKDLGRKLLSTLYVDNCVSSEHTVGNYQEFRRMSTEILQRAKMDLRLWLSNVDEFEDETTHTVSVLGIMWDRKTDELFVNVKGITTPKKITKRSILSTVQKVFDPIGFVSPATLPMKILLQRTWMSKKKWDEELQEDEGRRFGRWCEELPIFGEVKIPRVITNRDFDRSNWTLVTFTDACKDFYVACVFLRVESEGGVNVQLVAAKARVAPIKSLTIPKAELMGCLIGARQCASVREALKLEGVREIFFTDSMIALTWLRRADQWGTFVANRVNEINKKSNVNNWRHVPGKQNPADLVSRGCSPTVLLQSRWWEGPSWLYEQEEYWPVENAVVNEEEVYAERKKTKPSAVVSFTSLDHVEKTYTFSTMIRIVGWVRRFLQNRLVKDVQKRIRGPLSNDELKKAEFVFI